MCVCQFSTPWVDFAAQTILDLLSLLQYNQMTLLLAAATTTTTTTTPTTPITTTTIITTMQAR